MTYTALALLGVAVVISCDRWVFGVRLLNRKGFWVAYAIILFFQLVSNAVLTGLRIVRYNGEAILGSATPINHAPAFIGDGRIAFAPVEDLLFGFALVLLTLDLWIWWGRRGVQRTPVAGPPRFTPGRQSDAESGS
jgi:lycopene cyclase domain-containing protein